MKYYSLDKLRDTDIIFISSMVITLMNSIIACFRLMQEKAKQQTKLGLCDLDIDILLFMMGI